MVERVRQNANAAGRAVKRLLPLVTREKMTDYIGVARATLGWIAWCAGDETTAGEEAKAALEVWAESRIRLNGRRSGPNRDRHRMQRRFRRSEIFATTAGSATATVTARAGGVRCGNN